MLPFLPRMSCKPRKIVCLPLLPEPEHQIDIFGYLLIKHFQRESLNFVNQQHFIGCLLFGIQLKVLSLHFAMLKAALKCLENLEVSRDKTSQQVLKWRDTKWKKTHNSPFR